MSETLRYDKDMTMNDTGDIVRGISTTFTRKHKFPDVRYGEEFHAWSVWVKIGWAGDN